MGYTQNAPHARVTRQVAITSVDVIGHGAYGTGDQGVYYVDTSYYVGSVKVTPALGEQWVIQNVNGQWRLDHRIPFNDPNQASVTPTQGQHVVGSGQGPVELQGTQVNANGPLRLAPTPSSPADPGSLTYDGSVPAFYDGTAWVGLGTGGGGGSTEVFGEVPSGPQNGSNVTFSLSHPFVAGSTCVYRNGLRERLSVGYTESSPNLVFTTAPLSSDVVEVDYLAS